MTTSAADATPGRRPAVALAIDVVAVVVFVAIGRRSHDESGNAVAATLAVAGPFLIGLAVGWAVTWRRRTPFEISTGVVVWACTVVVGLLLRKFAFDRGIALPFVIVATLTLGVFLVGWRGIGRAMRR